MRFIDLHCHLLPGIDDGSSSIVETVEMLRIAHQRGTRGIVATPHVFQPMFATRSQVALCGSFSRMMEELTDMASYSDHSFLQEIEVHLGAENLVTPEFLQALEERKVLTLNGSRYLLVEFPLFMPFPLIVSAVDQILEKEMIPVLAHVERYEAFDQELERLDDLRHRGCVIQVNAEAFSNGGANERSTLALSLAKSGLVDVIASDGHNLKVRQPEVKGAFERLSEEFPEETVDRWMSENPARILGDLDLESAS
jgi:protein-tyrosine phosphatase